MAHISLTPQPDDQAAIEAVAPLLQNEFALSALAADPGRIDPSFWSRVAELGWTSASLDEQHGGAGFDVVQEMLMSREYGRFLAPISVLSTSLGIRLLARLGHERLASVQSGAERIGFAAFIAQGRSGAVLSGEAQLIDAEARHFLMVDGAGAAVFDRAAIGNITPVKSLDPTVTLARARLREVGADWLSAGDEALPLRAQLLIAAQLTGIALAASDMAAEYAKVREQFGKPIGAFQAVAHLCVDAAVRAKASNAQVAVAAIALRDNWPDAQVEVAAASHLAAGAAFLAATNNIQVHGGMGYSAESGAHLFLKRTVLLRRLLPLKSETDTVLLRRPPSRH
jgi:alkylation response protein AidB-like acyl-CoA dehydrogenase